MTLLKRSNRPVRVPEERAPARRRSVLCWAVLLPGALAPSAGRAQAVQFAGAMGEKALLVIDGQPRALLPGQSHGGVRLLGMQAGEALVEIGGAQRQLRLGAQPVSLGQSHSTAGNPRQIVLAAGPGGHFVTRGTVNNRAVQFMVDTGATTVALSQAEAERIGLEWRAGRRGTSSTANGVVTVHQLTLSAIRVGDVLVSNVEAIVLPASMPYVLLGNSFLGRFQMRRDNDTLRLDLKPI